ncbi:GNAT family N-acetyltransferase [Listeria ilorinensis]|uniref:GNAT family N-acetyltransferase n=1 Tax=Listeria ilorinensis TaxID=2867439 RepID=UPI001EF52F3E|nr:GNAT family N-acetyltransferase [Listeria ilorinensis]
MTTLTFRKANPGDVPLIFRFIYELAEHEGIEKEITATIETLRQSLFEEKAAEVVLGDFEGQTVGFALFFHNFSTLIGRKGLYLEDLYIIPEMRGKGFGHQFFAHLAELALEQNCGRFEWWCLNENKSGMQFYEKIGAEPMKDWTVHRLSAQQMKQLTEK